MFNSTLKFFNSSNLSVQINLEDIKKLNNYINDIKI
uniref:Uncharacterized protein n=1 Tax=Porphyridium purpureum TaxID=35688 RepID=W0RZ85_PORPP|nr:hypothetical protein Y721_p108 [Porphyridium purpureum]BAO23700.1 hypothetical protein [Porphyridium purpureum]